MLNDFAFGAGMKVGFSADAPLIFTFPLSLTIDDPLHSTGEDRIVLIGMSYKGKLLVVIHTERDNNIRIISAREATKKRNDYENSE